MTKKPNQNITVIGFSDVKIEDINAFLDQLKNENKTTIQFFDATKVAGPEHLYFAALNSLNAFEKKINILSIIKQPLSGISLLNDRGDESLIIAALVLRLRRIWVRN